MQTHSVAPIHRPSVRNVHIFNRTCATIALVYLLAIACLHDIREPGLHDYPQYQIAGSVAAAREWDSLYPIPIPHAVYNAGYLSASTEKPKAVLLAHASGINSITSHFMQPPPMALLLVPLGWVATAAQGYLLWLLFSAVAVWYSAVLSGRLFARCAGNCSYWSGVLMLLIAFAPATSRAIFVANVSDFMAVSIALAILSLDPAKPSQAIGAAAIVFGTMVKYAGLLFVPIAIRVRAWRTLVWSAITAATWTIVSLLVMGLTPFREYFTAIVPTLGRSHEYSDNVSLAGVILRMLHQIPPLPKALTIPIAMVQWVTLIVILLLLRLQDSTLTIESVAATAAALISWLLIFSPITWTHYLVYLYPLWGWMIWNGRRSKLHAAATIVAIGIIVFSLSTEPPTPIDPIGVRYLLSLAMTLFLGLESLLRTTKWRESMTASGVRRRRSGRGLAST